MATIEVTFPSDGPPGKILKWRIRPDTMVAVGRVLLLYKNDSEDSAKEPEKKLRATNFGRVKQLLVKNSDVVQPGQVIALLEGCTHPTVMKDLCAECGADLRVQNEKGGGTAGVSQASVAMVHSVPELKVCPELAEKIGKEDKERLLKDRKLVLLVDLDQTIVHTTNDNVPSNIKDVFHFQLYGPNSPWYHTRLRPNTRHFLSEMSKLYELHICTFGARIYAHTVASLLDKDGVLFSHRILSRDECFDPASKTANLKALFPCGDDLVCIIDDREDVWQGCGNLVQVKPYHFFRHTGDINAPPGLDKNNVLRLFEPVNTDGSCSTDSQDKKDNKNDDLSALSNEANQSSSDDPLMKAANLEVKEQAKEEAEQEGTVNEEEKENTDDNADSKTSVESEENTDSKEDTVSKEDTDSKENNDSKEDTDFKEDTDSKENIDSKEDTSSKEDTKENTSSAEDADSKENVDSKTNTASMPSINEDEKTDKKAAQPVEADKETRPQLPKEENKIIDENDSDDYLLYLEDILRRIHTEFYATLDRGNGQKSLRDIIPRVRSQVLRGLVLTFSGLIPTHQKLHQSRAYKVARAFGAEVTQDLIDKTTHLVAIRKGTAKANTAKKNPNIRIVNPDWLWSCAERWEHVDERLFPLTSQARGSRIPPPHCSSPEHIEEVESDNTISFANSINPLMSFSQEEIEFMDKEVDEDMDEQEFLEDADDTDDAEECGMKIQPSSSSEDSTNDESGPPKRKKRKICNGNSEKLDEDNDDDESDEDDLDSERDDNCDSDDDIAARFRRGEAIPDYLDLGDNSQDSIDDVEDGDDDREWNALGAALEREFLSE